MEDRASMDAMGVPSRQEHNNNPTPQEINDVPPRQRETDTSIVPTQDPNNIRPIQQQANIELAPEPPLNWGLNVLLEDIASNIDDRKLDRIKILFRGPGGLGKQTLEKCNTFTKLFDILRERGFISRGNLVYLNKILYTLNRPDLIERAAMYCRKEGNVVHYFKENIEEASHYRVKFHVDVDIKDINMETIDRIRNNVAKIVCAPVEMVLVDAVEPGSSLLVTLILPTMYTQILQTLLETGEVLWELTAVGIDTVVINDIKYSLTGIHGAEDIETEQQRKIMNIYEQLEQTKKDLERTEIQAIARNNEIHELKRLLSNNEKVMNEMQTSKETQERKNIELLSASSLLQTMELTNPGQEVAMQSFIDAISYAEVEGQDRGIIKRMIRASLMLVYSVTKNVKEVETKKKEAIREQRKKKEAEIHHQLVTGSITAEQALKKCAQYTLDVPKTFPEMHLKIINEVSQHLNEENRHRLMHTYDWENSGLIETCVELDKSLLLFALEIKETRLTKKIMDSDTFVKNLLQDVKRYDLAQLYVEKVFNEYQQNLGQAVFI